MRKLGLVVVDMQPKYLDDIPVEAQAGIVAGVADILVAAKKIQMPVALIEYADSGRTIPAVRRLIMTVPRDRRRVITKWHPSAFASTRLDGFLRSQGVNVLIIAGVHAHCCVRETAGDAVKAGYPVVTAPDLIADNPSISVRETWKWYGQYTTFYAHSAELIGVEIG